MEWLEQQVSALLDKEDFGSPGKHNHVAQFQYNLGTIEMAGFEFVDLCKEFAKYLGMVTPRDFASSLCEVGQFLPMPCHLQVDSLAIEEQLDQEVEDVRHLDEDG